MIFRCLLMVCFLGTTSTALAITPIVVPPPHPVSPSQVEVQPIDLGPATSCPGVYDNTFDYSGFYYGEQQGAQTMDDLHILASGALCSFTVGYNEPSSGFVDMTVWMYANTMSDSPPGALVGGPWVITNLPSGANTVTLNLQVAPLIPQNVWFAVQFSSMTAGLLVSETPLVGSSHDYFYEPASGYLSFGGSPVANFYIGVTADLPTPVRPTSWGTIKSLYQ